MLRSDVDIRLLDGDHLRGWLELTVPGELQGRPWGLLLARGGAPVRVVVAGQGARPVPDGVRDLSRASLAHARKALGVGLLVAVECDALRDILADLDRGAVIHSDVAVQSLSLWRAFRPWAGRGVWTEPRILERLPPIGAQPLQRTFDALIPDGRALAAYVFESGGGGIAASVIARKSGGDIDFVSSHRFIEDALPADRLARTWQSVHERLAAVIGERVAPVSILALADRAAVDRVLRGKNDQLPRELQSGGIILSQAPAWLYGVIGGAAAIAVAQRGAKAALRFLPDGAQKAARDLARGAASRIGDRADPFALLGFDPIALLQELRALYR